MKDKILGLSQKTAIELGLKLTDLFVLDAIIYAAKHPDTVKQVFDDEVYVWVSVSFILKVYPILDLNKSSILRHVRNLKKAGVVKYRAEGNQTFYTVCKVCEKSHTGVSKITHKHIESNIKEERKIKTSSLQKEKESPAPKLKPPGKETVAQFTTEFERQATLLAKDETLAFALRRYNIIHMEELLVEFKEHIIACCKQEEFLLNGYTRNRAWIIRATPRLDLAEATGLKLGVGEYINSRGERCYRHPLTGKEKNNVPKDAPPRQLRDQIWYAAERHWGPYL